MAMDDTESCSSRAVESSPTHGQPQHRHKLEVFTEVLRRLKESEHEDVNLPGFEDELWNHFNRLPPRYALDVNVERAEDVLNHKRLLHLAKDPAKRPVFDVRLVQVLSLGDGKTDCTPQSSPEEEDGQDSSSCMIRHSIHPPPAFGSSPNLEALALEGNICKGDDDSTVNGNCLLFRLT